MNKTIIPVMALVLSLAVVGVAPLVYAPSDPKTDQDQEPTDTTSIQHRLDAVSKIMQKTSDRFDKILTDLGPNQKIAKHLHHIDIHLGKIESKLQTLANKMPPGPPNDPAMIADLSSIISSANHIASTASSFQTQDPAVLTELNGIVANANAIIIIANSMLQ